MACRELLGPKVIEDHLVCRVYLVTLVFLVLTDARVIWV
jgi:hypothetical protein